MSFLNFSYPIRIIKAIFNRLNSRLSQKAGLLDTFLNKVCSSGHVCSVFPVYDNEILLN